MRLNGNAAPEQLKVQERVGGFHCQTSPGMAWVSFHLANVQEGKGRHREKCDGVTWPGFQLTR